MVVRNPTQCLCLIHHVFTRLLHGLGSLLIGIVIHPHEAHQDQGNQTDASSQESSTPLLLHACNPRGAHASKSCWVGPIALSRTLAWVQPSGFPFGSAIGHCGSAKSCCHFVDDGLQDPKHAPHCWFMSTVLNHAQSGRSMHNSVIALACIQAHVCSCQSFLPQDIKIEPHFGSHFV